MPILPWKSIIYFGIEGLIFTILKSSILATNSNVKSTLMEKILIRTDPTASNKKKQFLW